MAFSSGSVSTVLPVTRSAVRRIVLAFLATTTCWLATARADDILDRGAHFDIPASPLGSALIQFSTQSGVKVAAADEDVAQLNTKGVSGTYPAHTALGILLDGTGLSFLPVGTETVAIRSASTGPAVGALAAGDSLEAADGAPVGAPADAATQAGSKFTTSASGASAQFPDVAEMTPRPPTEQELAGDSLRQFITHHATVHYVNTGVKGSLAHWRGGKQSVCPMAAGLSPAYNAFVAARIRVLATNVGAPVDPDPHCARNLRIYFTNNPQELMTNVMHWASVYFRRHGEFTQMKPLLQFTSDHAIQGWYVTTVGGAKALNFDLTLLPVRLQPLWPRIIENSLRDSGDMSGIGAVVMVVDTSKVAGYPIGTIADYVGVLSLSVAQSPDHCDPLPSILDVMSPGCTARERPTAVTAGDLAFLKALYYRNTGLGSSPSRDDIQIDMLRQFHGGVAANR